MAISRIVRQMFRENTGSHFLDSGGAYGYRYNRKLPRYGVRVHATKWDWDCSINTARWVDGMCQFDRGMDRRFHSFARRSESADSGWLELMEEWTSQMHQKNNSYREETPRTFNTYNWDNELDRVLQGVTFWVDNEVYVILQSHNGCDVRGGYSTPHVFSIKDIDYFGDDRIEFYCPECGDSWEDPFYFEKQGGKVTSRGIKCPKGHKAVAGNPGINGF